MTVTAQSELIEIDSRRLVFSVSAHDDAGLIGEGMHERFIIDAARFTQKAIAKAEKQGTHGGKQ
jgi:predicted thioesterase